MMAKFHLKADGNPGACTAQEGNCPFGADAPHFSTEQDARTHYEHKNAAVAEALSKGRVPIDRTKVHLVTEHSKEVNAEDFVLAQEDLHMLVIENYGVEVGYYRSYAAMRDAMEDYDGDVLEVITTVETFDELGHENPPFVEHSMAAAEDEAANGIFRTALREKFATDVYHELTVTGEAARHTWSDDDIRTTYQMFLRR